MSSQQEYSSGGESHHSQPLSSERTKKAQGQRKHQRAERSLASTIVGPTKSRVTRMTNKAEDLLDTGAATLFTLKQVNPETEDFQDTLKIADTMQLDMKRTVHKLTSLYHFVEVNFDTPAMNASTLKDRYLKEVHTLIAKAKPHTLATKLQELIFDFEVQFKELGFNFTSYTRSDQYDSEPVDAFADHVQRTCDNDDLEKEQRLMEMQQEVQRLKLQVEQQKREAKLKEQETLKKTSELESWHFTQHASLQQHLLDTMSRESMAAKRAKELQAELDQSKNSHPREEILNTQQRQATATHPVHPLYSVDASGRIYHPDTIRAGIPTTQNSDQVRADRSTTNSTEQIRAGIPTTQISDQVRADRSTTHPTEQIRAGIPTTQSTDQVRAGRPTTGAHPENLQNQSDQPDYNKAMLELLQKIHEESMRSNTDIRAGINEILQQRERETADSYAEQYENAFAGAEEPRSGARQANTGRFSSAGNSHHEQTDNMPPPVYQMSPYERKFDPTKYLSTFDGTGDLEHFRYEFDTHVTQDPRFTVKDRFLILRKVLSGQALQHINLNKDPQEAIDKTFALLEKTYGNNQTQSSLLDKLANLPFHPSNPQTMRQNLATIINVLEQLKQKGIPENDPRTVNDIVRKLPVTIRRDVCEYMVERGDSITHNEVIDKIYSKIAGLDMDKKILSHGIGRSMNEITDSFGEINLINASHPPKVGSTHRPYPQHPNNDRSGNSQKSQGEKHPLAYVKEGLPLQYTDPVTGQTLEGYYAPGNNRPDIKIMHRTFPYQTPEKTKCPVCGGAHNAIRCTLTSTDFRKISAEKGLCPICACKHSIETCRSQFKCGYCGGTHHMGGCPKKEFYRDPKNYPAGAKDREQFFRAKAGNTSH